MTQRTLEKMDRAIKALEIARDSYGKVLIQAKTLAEIQATNRDWGRFIDLVCEVKKFRDELETAIYLKEKQG